MMDLFSIAGKILLDDGGVVTKLQNIDSKAQSTGGTFDEVFGRIKSAALKLGTALGVGMGFKEVFDEATETQGSLKQMDTVLQSTHDASGMTKQSLEELAESESKVTEYSKNQNMQAENLMLTFTRIGKDVFPGAVSAAQNMATAMHMDLNSATLQVGKALGNLSLGAKGGIQGLTMLQREGVNFSAAEKEQITTLLEANNVAGAQKIVLQELQTEFGGSAKAAGETFSGQLKILKNNLLDVGAGILEKLMPPMQTAFSFVNSHMPQIQSVIGNVINAVAPVISGLFNMIASNIPQIEQIVSRVAGTVSGAIQIIIPYIKPIITDIATIAGNLLPNLSGSATSISSVLNSTLKTALNAVKGLFDWMAQHGEAVKVAVLGIGGAFATFKVLETVSGTVSKVKNTFDTLTGAAGKVKGAIGNVGAAISLVKDIKKPSELLTLINSSGKFDGLFNAVTKIGSGFEGIGGKIAGFASNLNQSTAATKIATVAQAAFDAVMDANPIAIAVIAVAALTAAFIVLFNNCKPFHDWVINALNTLKGVAEAVGNSIKTTLVDAINGIKSAWGGITGFFSGLWNSIKVGASTAFNAIKAVFVTVWNTIKAAVMAVVTPLANGLTEAWKGVSTGISTVMNGLKTILSAAWDFIKTYVLGVVLLLCDLVTGNWTKLGEDAGKIFGKLAADLQAIWTGIQEVVTGVWQVISSFLTGLWTGIIGSAQTIWNGLSSFFSSLWAGISTALQTAWNAIKDFFAQFWANEIQGWKNIWTNVSAFFANLPGKLLGFVQNAGTAIINGFNAAVSFLTGLPEKFLAWGIGMISSLVSGIKSIIGTVGSTITGGFNAAITFITSLPGKALQWGKDFINGFINGIKGCIGDVQNAVTDVANKIRSFLHFSVPDEGPLSDADKYGADFMQLLSDTMEKNSDKPKEAAKKVADLVSDEISKIKSNTTASVKDLNSQILALENQYTQALRNNSSMKTAIANKYGEKIEAIRSEISGLESGSKGKGKNKSGNSARIKELEGQISALEATEKKAADNISTTGKQAISDEYKAKIQAIKDKISAVKDGATKEIAEIQRVGKMSKDELDQELQDRKDFASSVNDLADQIKDALKKKYEEDEQNQEDGINKELDYWENWKTSAENAINAVYKAKEDAIQSEIDAFDKETAAEDRTDTRKGYTDKISDLQDQITYSHDDYNKAQLQKQLASETADYQKELNKETTDDNKAALEQQKTDMESDKQSQLDSINAVYDAKKTTLNNELQNVKDTYSKMTSDASLEAQAEQMIMQNNQEAIVSLLNGYSDQYKQAGQTLGDKLAAGFQPAIDSIKSEIASINASISSARDNAISAMATAQQAAPSLAASGAQADGGSQSTVNNVNVNITSPQAQSPAEQARQAVRAMQKIFFQAG